MHLKENYWKLCWSSLLAQPSAKHSAVSDLFWTSFDELINTIFRQHGLLMFPFFECIFTRAVKDRKTGCNLKEYTVCIEITGGAKLTSCPMNYSHMLKLHRDKTKVN